MTGKQLADALHVAASTVSQWANGRRTPQLQDVERCDRALMTNGYLTRYFEKWVTREIPTEWRDQWTKAEASANLFQNFELSVIPGLLQTPDYARAVLKYNPYSPIAIEERVRRRIERQEILTSENPPKCIFVIDEYALRRVAGGRREMYDQLAQILDLAQRPNIVIKVVPTGTEYYAGCPFMIVRFDGTEIANLDDALDGQVITDYKRVTEITKIWEDIREAALSPQDSAVLIERVMEEWKP